MKKQTKCYCGHTTYCDCGPEEKYTDGLTMGQIIPKKEPCEHFTPTIGCIKDVCSCNKDPKQAPFKHKVESLSTEEVLANRSDAYEFIDFDKQETLEEVAIQKRNELGLKGTIDGFIAGAKWQAERIYNEEEVEDLIYNVCGTVARLQGITLNGNHIATAYKQFKKK